MSVLQLVDDNLSLIRTKVIVGTYGESVISFSVQCVLEKKGPIFCVKTTFCIFSLKIEYLQQKSSDYWKNRCCK